jgi:hypothetical protein
MAAVRIAMDEKKRRAVRVTALEEREAKIVAYDYTPTRDRGRGTSVHRALRQLVWS